MFGRNYSEVTIQIIDVYKELWLRKYGKRHHWLWLTVDKRTHFWMVMSVLCFVFGRCFSFQGKE